MMSSPGGRGRWHGSCSLGRRKQDSGQVRARPGRCEPRASIMPQSAARGPRNGGDTRTPHGNRGASPLDGYSRLCFDTVVTPRSGASTGAVQRPQGRGAPPGGRIGPPPSGRGASARAVLDQSPLMAAMRAARSASPDDPHPDWQTVGTLGIADAMTWLDTLDREVPAL